MDFIKFTIEHLKKEPMACNGHDRYSIPDYTRKLPKGIIPCDYDKYEKLIEVEFSNGERRWIKLETLFGCIISEVKNIYMVYPDGNIEDLSIVGIDVYKVKRTYYCKLIFERDLPF